MTPASVPTDTRRSPRPNNRLSRLSEILAGTGGLGKPSKTAAWSCGKPSKPNNLSFAAGLIRAAHGNPKRERGRDAVPRSRFGFPSPAANVLDYAPIKAVYGTVPS
jgi:hypothetical protein